MSTYRVQSVSALARLLRKTARKSNSRTVKALQNTARFGESVVKQKIAGGRKAPVDTGQLLRSVTSTKDDDGARVYTSEVYGPVLEIGRRRGKPPPIKAIEEWLARKQQRPRKKSRAKAKSKKKPRPKSAGQKVKKRKKRSGKKKRRTSEERFRLRARAVQASIARRGIRGRFFMKKSVPKMQGFLAKEMAKAMKDIHKP